MARPVPIRPQRTGWIGRQVTRDCDLLGGSIHFSRTISLMSVQRFISYEMPNRNYRSWNDRSIPELSLGMDLKEILAINLRLARQARQFTQEELAERSGLSSRYIGAIERADVSATVTVLGRIAKALGVEPETLIRNSKRDSAKGRDG